VLQDDAARHSKRASDKNCRWVTRIAGLEEEVGRLKRVRILDRSEASLPLDDFQYREVFDQISACLFVIEPLRITGSNSWVSIGRSERPSAFLMNR